MHVQLTNGRVIHDVEHVDVLKGDATIVIDTTSFPIAELVSIEEEPVIMPKEVVDTLESGQSLYVIKRLGKRTNQTTYVDTIVLTPEQSLILLGFVRDEVERLKHRAGGTRTNRYPKLVELLVMIDI